MLRRTVTGAIAAVAVVFLWGCSATPTDDNLTADQLQGLVAAGDLGLTPSFDLTFTKQPIALQDGTIESFWSESDGTPEGCFDTYSVSYLGGESGENDEWADIAGYYPDDGGAINVSGRSFDSADAASTYLASVEESAATCNDAGGYQLFDGEGHVGWDVTGVTVEPVTLDLPDGVTAVNQEETLADGFAVGYRVTLLQYRNVVVAVMAQQLEASEFTFDQVDKLAETVAGRLAALKP